MFGRWLALFGRWMLSVGGWCVGWVGRQAPGRLGHFTPRLKHQYKEQEGGRGDAEADTGQRETEAGGSCTPAGAVTWSIFHREEARRQECV